MIELTSLERFQLKWAARRERLRHTFRRKKQIERSARLDLARRQLAEEIAEDFLAL